VLSLGLRAAGGKIMGDDVRIALVLLPAMLTGFALSGLIKDRVSPQVIRNGILVVSTMASIALLLRAVV
jgi:hypothetical protein